MGIGVLYLRGQMNRDVKRIYVNVLSFGALDAIRDWYTTKNIVNLGMKGNGRANRCYD